MTGRRKSGRKAGSSSKKETPEKTRRSSRRRGQKKSESEDDSGSEQSVDGREETPKKEDLSREDESGGSDGAWQVRSENGNKGGIPKLKISLHRPAETSSPTPEPLSSPKPRRSRRGAANEEASEDGDDASVARDTVSEASENEGERRTSRSRKHRDKEGEHSQDTSTDRSEETNAAGEKEEPIQDAEKENQEETARLEEKRKTEEEKNAELEQQRKIEEEDRQAKKKAEEEKQEKQREERIAREEEAERERQASRKALEEKEKETKKKSLEEKEARRKLEEKEREARKREREEKEKEEQRKAEEELRKNKEEETARKKSKEIEKQEKEQEHNKEVVESSVVESVKAVEAKVDSDVEVVASRASEGRPERRRSRRSPSRDSSEERAKQAALASRKPKETAESDDGEVADSPEREISFPVRTEGKLRTSVSTAGTSTKENQDQPLVRKRRWGSSNSNQSAKKPLSISTDILKEIIPEVKPLALSEVELSLSQKEEIVLDDDKAIENQKKSEENARTTARSRRRRDVSSDESEKDYEEEAVDSDGEEMVKKKPPSANHMEVDEEVKEDVKAEATVALPVRKVQPADPMESLNKQRSPSPAKNPVSNILFITNLVRPFTVVQLRDLLARTGTIADEKGFWIDTIKSKCYVKYTSEDDAKNTRHALHGVRWPVSNPKQLNVDYSAEAAMTSALEGGRPVAGDADRHAAIEERRKRDKEREAREKERRLRDDKEPVSGRLGNLENGREVRRASDRSREREWEGDRERRDDKDEKPTRTVRKVTLPVREWDLGKAERGFSPPPPEDSRRFPETGRKRDQERQRSASLEPQKKNRRRDEVSPPKKILDDLFRKTKTTPCIYWLPLSEEQITEKETQRRKHMEEHEKRVAEERKKREAKRRRSRSRSVKK